MSEEKKELKKELKKNECCEGKEKLSIEELEKISGGDIGQYNNNTTLPPKPGEVTNDPREFLMPFDYKR